MLRLAVTYAHDMLPHIDKGPEDLFVFMREIPYREDPVDQEWVQRPSKTLDHDSLHGDCDDKAICVGAWAALRGYPFRFVALRNFHRSVVHHVVADVHFPKSGWTRMDVTYPQNTMGSRVPYAEELILAEWNPS
ncbi:MAG: transglutaminase domain-containing protein [Parcubacteria group bacterium]